MNTMGYIEQNKEALFQFIREPLLRSNHRKFGKTNNAWLCIQRNLTIIKRDIQHRSRNPSFATILQKWNLQNWIKASKCCQKRLQIYFSMKADYKKETWLNLLDIFSGRSYKISQRLQYISLLTITTEILKNCVNNFGTTVVLLTKFCLLIK